MAGEIVAAARKGRTATGLTLVGGAPANTGELTFARQRQRWIGVALRELSAAGLALAGMELAFHRRGVADEVRVVVAVARDLARERIELDGAGVVDLDGSCALE